MAFFSLKNILNSLPFKILSQIGPRAVRERVKVQGNGMSWSGVFYGLTSLAWLLKFFRNSIYFSTWPSLHAQRVCTASLIILRECTDSLSMLRECAQLHWSFSESVQFDWACSESVHRFTDHSQRVCSLTKHAKRVCTVSLTLSYPSP